MKLLTIIKNEWKWTKNKAVGGTVLALQQDLRAAQRREVEWQVCLYEHGLAFPGPGPGFSLLLPSSPPVSKGSLVSLAQFPGDKVQREWWVMFAGLPESFPIPTHLSFVAISGQRRSRSLGGGTEPPFPRVLSWEHLFSGSCCACCVWVLCTGLWLFCCSF